MSFRTELRQRVLVAAVALLIGVLPSPSIAQAADPAPAAADPAGAPSDGAAAAGEPSASATASATTPANAAAGENCQEPLCYTATSLDAERNRIVLHDIDIVDTTRGNAHIKADLAEATGLDIGNSQWVLTGHVHASTPQGQLSAERATVTFVNKRIALMTAHGSPAVFERAGGGVPADAHGHASQIIFDMDRNELQLSGDAWLTDGCEEINSPHITYDIASQRVQADSTAGDGNRVRGLIHGRTQSPCGPQTGRP